MLEASRPKVRGSVTFRTTLKRSGEHFTDPTMDNSHRHFGMHVILMGEAPVVGQCLTLGHSRSRDAVHPPMNCCSTLFLTIPC